MKKSDIMTILILAMNTIVAAALIMNKIVINNMIIAGIILQITSLFIFVKCD